MHVRAFAAALDIERVSIFSPTPARREALASLIASELEIPAKAADDAETAVRSGDVVLAAARSYGEQPILFGDWLDHSSTVVSIGSTVPAQREIDASVVSACDLIVCDAVEEVTEQTGDMLAATRASIDFHEKIFSLHQLLAGEIDDRVSTAQRPLFKSVGGGLQDVVVAEVVLEQALAAGLATPLPIEFEKKR